ncbi:MAG: radical SAM protein [Clostridia bacterium]|nr:radical SAM protein [Clostridia bacterium]
MNLYRGCSHGCIYCDARSTCYRLDSPGEVRAKMDALALLRSELRSKKKPGLIGLGGMSDGYNPEEKTAEITRGALALLSQYGFGIGVTTKSPLVARDIDLFRAIQRNMPAHVTFSITAADNALSRKIEPGVAGTRERFEALRQITDAGVPAGVWINPMLPFLTDSWENVRVILHMAKQYGARYALTHYGMTLRDGNREFFYEALDRDFPGIRERYIESYGNAYSIPVPGLEALRLRYEAECGRLGLAFTFEETNRIIQESGGARQQMLF